MTIDELKIYIVKKLMPKYWADFQALQSDNKWAQLVQSVQAASSEDKNTIVSSLANKDYVGAGIALASILKSRMRSLAESEANNMVADSALSIDEIDRILS